MHTAHTCNMNMHILTSVYGYVYVLGDDNGKEEEQEILAVLVCGKVVELSHELEVQPRFALPQVCVYMCVYMRVCDRESARAREREKERERKREREREGEREREREEEREKESERRRARERPRNTSRK